MIELRMAMLAADATTPPPKKIAVFLAIVQFRIVAWPFATSTPPREPIAMGDAHAGKSGLGNPRSETTVSVAPPLQDGVCGGIIAVPGTIQR